MQKTKRQHLFRRVDLVVVPDAVVVKHRLKRWYLGAALLLNAVPAGKSTACKSDSRGEPALLKALRGNTSVFLALSLAVIKTG